VRWFNGKGEVWEVDLTVSGSLNCADQDGRAAAHVHDRPIAIHHEQSGLSVQERRASLC
jgi:hypothetical protein